MRVIVIERPGGIAATITSTSNAALSTKAMTANVSWGDVVTVLAWKSRWAEASKGEWMIGESGGVDGGS